MVRPVEPSRRRRNEEKGISSNLDVFKNQTVKLQFILEIIFVGKWKFPLVPDVENDGY